jgi:glycosyltransferase involved in cell wall biosynthesis
MKPPSIVSRLLRKALISIVSRLVPLGLLVIQAMPRLRELILEALRSGPSGHVGLLGAPNPSRGTHAQAHFDGSWRSSISMVHLVAINCPTELVRPSDFRINWGILSALPYVISTTLVHNQCQEGSCGLGGTQQASESLSRLEKLFNNLNPRSLIVLAPINSPPSAEDLRALVFELESSSHACLWQSSKVTAISNSEKLQKEPFSESLFDPKPPQVQHLILGDTIILRNELAPYLHLESGILNSRSSEGLRLHLTKHIAEEGWTHSHSSSWKTSQLHTREAITQLKRLNDSNAPLMSPFEFHRLVRKQMALSVEEQTLGQKAKQRILIIQPILGGGLVHADTIMSECAASNFDVIWMSTAVRSIELYVKDSESGLHKCILSESFEPVDAQTHRSVSYDSFLLKALISLKIDLVIIQHLSNQSFGIRQVCDSLGVKFVVSAHDFYVGCMSHNLLDEANVYCGGVCSSGSGSCKTVAWPSSEVSNLKNGMVSRFRQGTNLLLKGAAGHIFPDLSTKSVLESIHGEIFSNSLVLPFPIPVVQNLPSTFAPTRRVAVLGDLRENKGAQIIRELIPALEANGIATHIFGGAHPSLIGIGVHHGPYKPEHLASLVSKVKPDVVVLASPWPETFSFVLSEALCMGLPVVARNIGAFRSRLYGKQFARLVDSPLVDDWLETILDVYGNNQLQTMRKSLLEWQEKLNPAIEASDYSEKLNLYLKETAKN